MLMIGKNPLRSWVISVVLLFSKRRQNIKRKAQLMQGILCSLTLHSGCECSLSRRQRTFLMLSTASPKCWSRVSAECWGREVSGAVSCIQGILQQLGKYNLPHPAAAQHFSPVPMGQSGYSGCPRPTAANPQGDRGHLKGNADIFAVQPLCMEGLDELLEDNLITV